MNQNVSRRRHSVRAFMVARMLLVVLTFGFGWSFARVYPVQAGGAASLEYVGVPGADAQAARRVALADDGPGDGCDTPESATDDGCDEPDEPACDTPESPTDDGCDDVPDDPGCDTPDGVSDDSCDDVPDEPGCDTPESTNDDGCDEPDDPGCDTPESVNDDGCDEPDEPGCDTPESVNDDGCDDVPDDPGCDTPDGVSDDGCDEPDDPGCDTPAGVSDDGCDEPDDPSCDTPESASDDGCDEPDEPGCDTAESVNDDGCDDGPDDGQFSEQRARVVSMPDGGGLVGAWNIGDVEYVTTLDTEFDPRFGAFDEGVCVKLHFTPGTQNIVSQLRTEQDFRCDGDGQGGNPGDPQHSKFFGVINSFPAGLLGTWTIGEMEFVANGGTEFKSPSVLFGEGVTVKVVFVTDDSGVKTALRIQTLFQHDDGDDDDGNGFFDGAEGKAFGKIDSFPPELIGLWKIGGIEYTAVEQTEFDQEDGSFAEGVRVKVEYFINSAGDRIAKEIETTDDDGGVDDDGHLKLVGFVEELPATGFLGDWLIGNVPFVFDANTIVEEEHGALGDGAYVEVEYEVVEGANVIRKIETHVPPGGGDDDSFGAIEAIGGGSEGIDGEAVTATVWRIGGEAYLVTPATQTSERSSSLSVGSTASVNSYVDAGGNQVATRIVGIAVDTTIFIPVVGN